MRRMGNLRHPLAIAQALAFLAFAAACLPARATEDAVLLRCDRQAGELVIEYLVEPPPASASHADEERVRFRDLLEVERCGPGHPLAGDACTVRGTKTAERTCQLGGRVLSVRITPQPYNYNLQGQCGARITGVLEVREGQASLLRPTPLDPNRDCASGDQEVVKTVRIRRDEPRPRVTHGPRAF